MAELHEFLAGAVHFDARRSRGNFEKTGDVVVGHLLFAAKKESSAFKRGDIGEGGEDAVQFGLGVEGVFESGVGGGRFVEGSLPAFDPPVLDVEVPDDGEEVGFDRVEVGGGGGCPDAEKGFGGEVLGAGGIAGKVHGETVHVAAVLFVEIVKISLGQTHIESMEEGGICYGKFFASGSLV